MSFYKKVYQSLCESRKNRKDKWDHAHHIIPRHVGGDDSEDNITRLTLREHTIAHFLLWKIHGNYKDKCAYKMLMNNECGSWNPAAGGQAGAKTQMEQGIGIHTTDQETRRQWASLGGKSLKGRKTVHKNGVFKRVLPEDVDDYMLKGWSFGTGFSARKGKKFGPSPKRKRVSIEGKEYDSLHIAADNVGMTPSGTLYRIRSEKYPTWCYVSDIE